MLGPLFATALAALSIQPVATGLQSPVHVAAPRSEPGKLYIVEQRGVVRVVDDGKARPAPFIDISAAVRSGGEQGLLSIAFHPSYAKNRRFFLNYTDLQGHTRVVEYRSNGRVALMNTRRQLLMVKQPYSNHNGGQVAFGPDGRLYVGMGDGGAGGDPQNVSQDLGSRLGKLLARNVDKAGSTWQIAGSGLRNPWRFSFDRATGDLYIGDVGQNAFEEIHFLPRVSPGLENYGWDVYEGRSVYEDKQPGPGRLIPPVAVYDHGQGCSVTGGFVYRGKKMPAAVGRYFYGDYCSGNVWSLKIVRGKATSIRREPFQAEGLTSFGEDADGELYLAVAKGTVLRLVG